MKTRFRRLVVGILLATASMASAQQVNTLYFLENAPMRHTINPAFQPVSRFYLTLPVVGYTSLWAGTNNWTMADFVFKGADGNTITAWHPNAPAGWLAGKPKEFAVDADIDMNIVGLGFAIKDFGYFHINVSEHIYAKAGMSSDILGLNNLDTSTPTQLGFGVHTMAYSEVALGYSHKINNKWSVGGKVKVLVGQMRMDMSMDELALSSTSDAVSLSGSGNIYVAAPLRWSELPSNVSDLESFDPTVLFMDENAPIQQTVMELIKPSGLGASFDVGVTYKPIKNLQITASATDLGFIRWHRHAQASMSVDTAFYGVDLNYGDYVTDGQFNSEALGEEVSNTLSGYMDALHISEIDNDPFPKVQMLTANLHVGLDANFWKNRIGIGVYSRTRFCESQIVEEVSMGVALRPANWFNLAASYSFTNGHWSNLGAALSIAPYDGIMLTLATDYVPLSYANAATEIGEIPLPYKTPGMNVAFGLAIVAGTNPKKSDKDKDGVFDRLDVCPNTPLNVRVNEMGCPLDIDGDDVPDYMDECPYTPSAAYGMVDSVGCPEDGDGDAVPDYRDLCPDTPEEAIAHVDANGCTLDSDGDGIYDYKDICANTPKAAYGMVDASGCPLDTDGDGVYDYLDLCPDTKEEAYGMVDANGCPLDTDMDGVYDYCDECKNTIPEARRFVDSVGCTLDTDKDGIYDYEDHCPTIPGVKANKGCPEIKREVRNLLNKAMKGIQFENGRATIKPNSYKILDDIAKIFIENPTYVIEVQGHTYNVGQYDYNMDLSDRRAHAVRLYLINKGVPAARMSARGYGPDMPIDDNNTAEGRSKNRRVEFQITFEEVTYEVVNNRAE